MVWITIEIGFSILLPGVLPTLILLWGKLDYLNSKIGFGNLFFLFLFFSMIIGLLLEFSRFSSETIEIDLLPSTIVGFLKRIFLNKKAKRKSKKTRKKESDTYKEEEAKAIKFWITYYYMKKKDGFEKALKNNPRLMKFIDREYSEPKVSVTSDKWIVLSLLQGEARRFLWEEYFIYYQASYNHMLSMLLSFVLYFSIYTISRIKTISSLFDILKLLVVPLIFIILSIFFGNVAFHWKIAIRKLAKKIILYSQLYD